MASTNDQKPKMPPDDQVIAHDLNHTKKIAGLEPSQKPAAIAMQKLKAARAKKQTSITLSSAEMGFPDQNATLTLSVAELNSLPDKARYQLGPQLSDKEFLQLRKELHKAILNNENIMYMSLKDLAENKYDPKVKKPANAKAIAKIVNTIISHNQIIKNAYQRMDFQIPLTAFVAANVTLAQPTIALQDQKNNFPNQALPLTILSGSGIDFQNPYVNNYYFSDSLKTEPRLRYALSNMIENELKLCKAQGIDIVSGMPRGFVSFARAIKAYTTPEEAERRINLLKTIYWDIFAQKVQNPDYQHMQFYINPLGDPIKGDPIAENRLATVKNVRLHNKDVRSVALALSQMPENKGKQIALQNAGDSKGLLSTQKIGMHWNRQSGPTLVYGQDELNAALSFITDAKEPTEAMILSTAKIQEPKLNSTKKVSSSEKLQNKEVQRAQKRLESAKEKVMDKMDDAIDYALSGSETLQKRQLQNAVNVLKQLPDPLEQQIFINKIFYGSPIGYHKIGKNKSAADTMFLKKIKSAIANLAEQQRQLTALKKSLGIKEPEKSARTQSVVTRTTPPQRKENLAKPEVKAKTEEIKTAEMAAQIKTATPIEPKKPEPAPEPAAKTPMFHTIDVNKTAEDLRKISWALFSQLNKNDFSNVKAEKDSLAFKNIIRASNNLAYHVANDILSGATTAQRTVTLEQYIAVMKKSFELNDLHSAFAISGAISSKRLELKAELTKLSPNAKAILAETQHLIDKHLSQAEDYVAAILHAKSPMIPYMGGIRTRFVQLDELSKKNPQQKGSQMAAAQLANQIDNLQKQYAKTQSQTQEMHIETIPLYNTLMPKEEIKRDLDSLHANKENSNEALNIPNNVSYQLQENHMQLDKGINDFIQQKIAAAIKEDQLSDNIMAATEKMAQAVGKINAYNKSIKHNDALDMTRKSILKDIINSLEGKECDVQLITNWPQESDPGIHLLRNSYVITNEEYRPNGPKSQPIEIIPRLFYVDKNCNVDLIQIDPLKLKEELNEIHLPFEKGGKKPTHDGEVEQPISIKKNLGPIQLNRLNEIITTHGGETKILNEDNSELMNQQGPNGRLTQAALEARINYLTQFINDKESDLHQHHSFLTKNKPTSAVQHLVDLRTATQALLKEQQTYDQFIQNKKTTPMQAAFVAGLTKPSAAGMFSANNKNKEPHFSLGQHRRNEHKEPEQPPAPRKPK